MVKKMKLHDIGLGLEWVATADANPEKAHYRRGQTPGTQWVKGTSESGKGRAVDRPGDASNTRVRLTAEGCEAAARSLHPWN